MTEEDEKFLKRLLITFKVEAEEHLKSMLLLLQTLESPLREPQPLQAVETLFREAHSLKGAARSVNLSEVESICQALESVLVKLKRGEVGFSPRFFDVFYQAIDQLALDIADGVAGKAATNSFALQQTIRALEYEHNPTPTENLPAKKSLAVTAEESVIAPQIPATAEIDSTETVRISTARLGSLLVQVEELMAFKFSAGHFAGELRGLNSSLSEWEKKCGKPARDRKLRRRSGERQDVRQDNNFIPERQSTTADRMPNAVEDDEYFLKAFSGRLNELERQAASERRSLSGMLDNLLHDMKHALMLPFSTLFEWVPKLVRDLARDSGKEVDVTLQGAVIEIDRRILEQMKSPLIHLIRNAVDHGIETPNERVRKGKPARGRISLEVTPKDGNKIELLVADDGAGLDVEQVVAGAVKLGIVPPESLSRFSRQEAMALVFESGLSTSSILTDVSGRGLGLAIVREKVEKLGGTVELEEGESGGTRFRIVLPTTLATFRGLVVAIDENQFVLPSINVERVARVPRQSIRTVENRNTIELDGSVLSLVSLADVLQLSNENAVSAGADYQPVAVLTGAGKRIAFSVDAIIGDQEVLVKNLGPQLLRVPNVAGATILDRGRLVPILNVPDLMKSALKVTMNGNQAIPERQARSQSLLVVEDSITSRSLLKNILESAGYRVATAVDGIDALTALRTAQFDLVVSDVEMPRLDGFGLTGKIRSDRKLSNLPVILVTALDSREHKERGIEVGANAYIVKSTFDQSNLLDAIRRLI